MTEKKFVEHWQSGTRPIDSIEEMAAAEARRFGALNGGRQEPYLKWAGALMCIVLAVAALAVVVDRYGRPGVRIPPAGAAPAGPGRFQARLPDRSNCAEIGASDLRSPLEGIWFQASCMASRDPSLAGLTTNCNRTSPDAGFTLIAPGLYVFRPTQSSGAFLWYARSATCLDLVSTRAVTAVCVDQTVSFSWSARAACAAHGDILAWVNGR